MPRRSYQYVAGRDDALRRAYNCMLSPIVQKRGDIQVVAAVDAYRNPQPVLLTAAQLIYMIFIIIACINEVPCSSDATLNLINPVV